jgi:hypothetical protein
MKKQKIDPKYAKLIAVSGEGYKNRVYLSDALGALVSTDGKMMLAERENYAGTKALARLLDSNNALTLKDNVLTKCESDYTTPNFSDVVPGAEEIGAETTKKVRTILPAWLNTISKKTKRQAPPEIHFILDKDEPILALQSSEGSHSKVFNAHFLANFAGLEVDLYFIKNKSYVLIMPTGDDISSAPWFSIIMETKPKKQNAVYF